MIDLIYKDLLNLVDEDLLILLIEKDKNLISLIDNPTSKICNIFIKRYGEHSIGLIQNIPESVLKDILEENGEAIMFLKHDPSVRLQKIAVKNHCGAIFHMNNPSNSVILESIKYIDFDMFEAIQFVVYYYRLIKSPKIFWKLYEKLSHDETSLRYLKNHKYYKDDAKLIMDILKTN